MCEENREALSIAESKHDAIKLYKRTIDWALEEGYPSISTIRRFFSDCESEGVFVDKVFHGEALLDHQVYVFHHCRGAIRTGLNVGKGIIPMLYFANDCDMDIRGIMNSGTSARVPLYVFGSNRIRAERSEDIESVIYKFEAK